MPLEKIDITRDMNDKVSFATVTVFVNDNVFFSNLDPKAAHKPSICKDEVLSPPSPKSVSSQCVVPLDTTKKPPYPVRYTCLSTGHGNEFGIINVQDRPAMP